MKQILDINLGNFPNIISSLRSFQTFNNMANIKSIAFVAFLSLGLISYNPAMGQQTRSPLDFWLTFVELLTTDAVNALTTFQLPPIELPSLPKLPNFQLPNFQLPNIQGGNIQIPNIKLPDLSSLSPLPPLSSLSSLSPLPPLSSLPPLPSLPSLPSLSSLTQSLPAPPTLPDYDAYIKQITQLCKLYRPLAQAFPFPSPFAPMTPARLQTSPVQSWPVPMPAPTPAPMPAPCFKPADPCINGCKPEKVKIIVVDDCDEKNSRSSESFEESDEVGIVVPYTNRGRFQYKKRTNK